MGRDVDSEAQASNPSEHTPSEHSRFPPPVWAGHKRWFAVDSRQTSLGPAAEVRELDVKNTILLLFTSYKKTTSRQSSEGKDTQHKHRRHFSFFQESKTQTLPGSDVKNLLKLF